MGMYACPSLCRPEEHGHAYMPMAPASTVPEWREQPMSMNDAIRSLLSRGVAIPASPLALTAARKLDERRQRALFRYYAAAGVGGIAVGVHTTQFAIRNPEIGLFEPVLTIGREEMDRADQHRTERLVRV